MYNRIQAEVWIEKIEKAISEYEWQLATMQANNNDKVIDELQAEYNQILETIKQFSNKQDCVNNKMFRIDYRI